MSDTNQFRPATMQVQSRYRSTVAVKSITSKQVEHVTPSNHQLCLHVAPLRLGDVEECVRIDS
eukprot:5345214-Amphidinium_carterae.1